MGSSYFKAYSILEQVDVVPVPSPGGYIQSAFNYGTFDGLATVAKAFTTANVVAGDIIYVMVWWDSVSITLNGVADNSGSNTYTLIGSPLVSGSYSCQAAYAVNVAGGSKWTVTATLSATTTRKIIAITEIRRAILDAASSNGPGFLAAGLTINSGAVTTTTTNDYVIAGFLDGGSNSSVWIPGSGFNSRISIAGGGSTNVGLLVDDTIKTTSGSITPSTKSTSATNCLCMTAAFI